MRINRSKSNINISLAHARAATAFPFSGGYPSFVGFVHANDPPPVQFTDPPTFWQSSEGRNKASKQHAACSCFARPLITDRDLKPVSIGRGGHGWPVEAPHSVASSLGAKRASGGGVSVPRT